MEPVSHTSDENEGLAGLDLERSERKIEPGEAAGLLSSRPPSNPISYGGEDYLTLSLYLNHRRFSELKTALEKRQLAAVERREGADEITLAGKRFLVLPFGAKVGSKFSKAHFQWQLKCEIGYTLALMKRETCQGTMPNGKLDASSLVLMRFGLQGVVDHAFAALRALGAQIDRNKVSRVDVCCDLPGAKIAPLCDAFAAGNFVSRAASNDQHCYDAQLVDVDGSVYRLGTEPTSCNLGRGDVRLRIYEKVKECKHDLEKLRTLVERRWGVFPFNAVRAEFQLRRGKLKKLGVDHLDDWIAKRATIVRYLSHDWFRLTDGTVDRKHPERSPILPEYLLVQQAFAAWTGEGPSVDLDPIVPQPMPADHYTRGVVGSFISLFARSGVDIDSNDTFIHEAVHRLLDQIESRDMAAEVQRRALERGVGGIEPAGGGQTHDADC